MRGMRYVFAVIVRVQHETLWRIVVEAQVAPSFSTGAPTHEKMRYFAEITLRPTFPKILLKALKNFALLLANEHLNLTELSR